MRALIDGLLTHPFVSIFVAVLSMAAAFTTGIVLVVGTDLVPLMDKAEILASMVLYSSILGVFLRSTWLMVKFLSVAEGVPLSRLPPASPAPYFAVTIGCLLCTFALFLAGAFGGFGDFLASLVLLASMLSLLVAVATAAINPGSSERTKKMSSIAIAVVILGASYGAGALWADYLQGPAEKSLVLLAGEEAPRRGRVVMQAMGGLIFFFDGVGGAEFVPLSEIVSVRSGRPSVGL